MRSALSTYAVFTSRRSPPPPTPFLPAPPLRADSTLSSSASGFCWSSDLPHMPLLGSTFITPFFFPPLTLLKQHCVSSPSSPLPEFPRPPSPLTSDDCWCAASTLCVGYKAPAESFIAILATGTGQTAVCSVRTAYMVDTQRSGCGGLALHIGWVSCSLACAWPPCVEYGTCRSRTGLYSFVDAVAVD